MVGADRPRRIKRRSPSFTAAMSSGRLRNQGRNAAHQATPSSAIRTKARRGSPVTLKSQTSRIGAITPPSRLDVQMTP